MPEKLLQKENIEQQPFEKQAETSLSEMNDEMGKFLGELDTLEKSAENVAGDEGEKLREQIKELKNEAKFTADWWAGNILAFTNLVVGDGINFPAIEKIKEQNKQETLEEMRERAKNELAENGITSEQARAYQSINEVFKKGITPFIYEFKHHVRDLFLGTLISGEKKYGEWEGKSKYREDAWSLYLGIPQKNDTFGVSEYQPDISEDYCYRIKDYWKLFIETPVEEGAQSFSGLIQSAEEAQKKGKKYRYYDYHTNVMGWFSVELGEDEKGSYVAYSDIWDLAIFPENEKGFFGKPFHIYDRLYYDTETYEPIYE